MNKELILLIVNLLSNRNEVIEYCSELGVVWSSDGEIGWNEKEIWCEEFMSGEYKWMDKGIDGINIEFEYNDEDILCFKLWIGNLFINGIF